MNNFKDNISIPSEIDNAINNGIAKGRVKVGKKNRRIRGINIALAVVIVSVGTFAGSVNIFPAFAESMSDVPVMGRLVTIFKINKQQVSGGYLNEESSKGEIKLKKNGKNEELIISFENSEMSNLYNAKYSRNPQSITITLPGTRHVTAESEFKRANGESNFIKSVYPLITLDDSTVRYVVELENDCDVQISELKNPGQIVMKFTEKEDVTLDTVYSARTYSYENDEQFAQFEEELYGQEYRILKDEVGKRFFEIKQFNNKGEADKFVKEYKNMPLLVEQRVGNNVPLSFRIDSSDYEDYNFNNLYVDFLKTAEGPEDIMKFIDAQQDKNSKYNDIMLNGLTGMLKGMDEKELDFKKLDKYYALIGTTAKKVLNK